MNKDNLNVYLCMSLACLFCIFIWLCAQSELQSKDRVEVVYDDNGVVEFVKINQVEHQVIPTTKVDYMLDLIDVQSKQLQHREEQIASYEKISERQKADLEMCRTDRAQAYSALDKCIAKEVPFHQEPTVAFASGYAVCAATFAVWQYTTRDN